jgi:hypothetical protein
MVHQGGLIVAVIYLAAARCMSWASTCCSAWVQSSQGLPPENPRFSARKYAASEIICQRSSGVTVGTGFAAAGFGAFLAGAAFFAGAAAAGVAAAGVAAGAAFLAVGAADFGAVSAFLDAAGVAAFGVTAFLVGGVVFLVAIVILSIR